MSGSERSSEIARALRALADENESWEWQAPVGPGNASYANGYENGRRAVGADLRALIAACPQTVEKAVAWWRPFRRPWQRAETLTSRASTEHLCHACDPHAIPFRSFADSDALTDGDWVNDRGIQRWVPHGSAA